MLGMLIKEYLDKKGIKYSFIANKAGIPIPVFSAMLSCKRKIIAEEYIKLCRILDVDVRYFAEKILRAG